MADPGGTSMELLLVRAARSVPVPDADAFAAGVAQRLRSAPDSGVARPAGPLHRKAPRPARRRAGVVVTGVAAAAILVVASVAPVRSAVAGFLGVDGVHIRITPTPTTVQAVTPTSQNPSTTLPVDPVAALHLGQQTTLVGAARRVGFPMRLPTTSPYQQPDAVYVGTPPAEGMAAMVYLSGGGRPAVAPGGVAALLTEFRGHLEAGFFQKLAGAGTTVDDVMVGPAAGYWLSGAPHQFYFVNPDGSVDAETIRLASNTLLWSAGGITYRFESALSRDAAVTIATSMR